MNESLRFFWDTDNAPRATGTPQHLAVFLESDIQDAVEIIDDLLALLTLPQNAEFNGNTHSVSIEAETVTLSNQFDEESVDYQLNRDDFAQFLDNWRQFLGRQASTIS